MLTELLAQIDSYLLGHFSLEYLEEWLVSHLQKILDSGEQEAVDLANKIDADIIESSEGIIDQSTIWERLQSYITSIQTVSLECDEYQPTPQKELVTTSSESTTLKAQVPVTLVEEHRFQASFV